jgi:hypothetical protein
MRWEHRAQKTGTATLFVLGFLVLSGTPAFAQTGDSSRQLSPAELEAQKALEAQKKSQKALADFLRTDNGQSRSPNGLNSLFFQFRTAIPKFRTATDEFRWVVSMQGKIDKQAKQIGTQADVMLKYLSAEKMNHPKPDPQEFKDYSASELRWETLNSAERISAYLDFAVAAEREETVSQKTLQFLYILDGELLRLKWLTAHVK